jgi:translation initiation factor 1 (eIF-1/SUI1)
MTYEIHPRGMMSPMEVRREILKELKKSLGVGGTLVDGVLELQGAYADKAVQVLHKKGYAMAKKI